MNLTKQPLTNKDFKYIFSRVPRLCVEVVLMTKGGIVLTKRTIPPAMGKWHIPGGTVHHREKLEQAVLRKAQEELGMRVKVVDMLGVIEYNLRNYFGWPVGIAFLVKSIGHLNLDKASEPVAVFKTLPSNIIREQRDFLSRHLKIK